MIRAAIACLLLTALAVADHRGWLLVSADDDLRVYHGRRAAVSRVIDGDTIEVSVPDRHVGQPTTRLRLWGIDCPEAGGPDRRPEPGADAAAAFTRDLAAGHDVRIELEPTRLRDAWGRPLAHVILPDGRSLNEALLAAGLARLDQRWPHRRLEAYARAERAARLLRERGQRSQDRLPPHDWSR